MTSPAHAGADRPIRVGVAGLGAVAQAVHLPLLARHADEFEIAAICETTGVHIDRQARKAMPFHDDIRTTAMRCIASAESAAA